jgi:glycosyltransferase involved in cell wall biosynthesis
MKILQLCPLWSPIARDAAGGIETFVAQLIEALHQRDFQVTLLASGDSCTTAELVPVTEVNLRDQMQMRGYGEYRYYEQHLLQLALERAAEFDVVHSHIGIAGHVLSGVPGLGQRVLHTIHTPVYPDLEWFVSRYPSLWLSTVSEFQAGKLCQRRASRCRVISNGIDVDRFTFQAQGGQGLLFLGRMEWEKGPDIAVNTAQKLGYPLTLAGPIIDQEFFDRAIKPLLGGQVRYVGKVDHHQKCQLFGQAACVLLPSRWEEPFGLVAVEAMACGTPVVALASGALPEIVEPGLTGYLTDDEGELAALVTRSLELDRFAIRRQTNARFNISTTAERYSDLYAEIVSTSH